MNEYKGWNIQGIAEEVVKTMREENGIEEELDDYLRDIVYNAVYSKDPSRASLITELVREYIEENDFPWNKEEL